MSEGYPNSLPRVLITGKVKLMFAGELLSGEGSLGCIRVNKSHSSVVLSSIPTAGRHIFTGLLVVWDI